MSAENLGETEDMNMIIARAASGTPLGLACAGTDASLVSLRPELRVAFESWCRAVEMQSAAEGAHMTNWWHPDVVAAEAAVAEAEAPFFDLVERMLETRAKTVEGMRLKVEVARGYRDEDLMQSLIDDLAAMAGVAPGDAWSAAGHIHWRDA